MAQPFTDGTSRGATYLDFGAALESNEQIYQTYVEELLTLLDGSVAVLLRASGADVFIDSSSAFNDLFLLRFRAVGAEISVRIAFEDAHGTTETASTETGMFATVENVQDPVTGAPLVVGQALEDETFLADVSGIEDEDGISEVTYQWYADRVEIFGATLSEFRAREQGIGTRISVKTYVTDSFGVTERLESALADPIEALPRLLIDNSSDDVQTGNLGNDTLEGGGSNDLLKGDAGDDLLNGGSGNNT